MESPAAPPPTSPSAQAKEVEAEVGVGSHDGDISPSDGVTVARHTDGLEWAHELHALIAEQRDVERSLLHLYKPPHGFVQGSTAAVTKPAGFRTFGNVALVTEAAAANAALGSTVDWVLQVGAVHDKLEANRRAEATDIKKQAASFSNKLKAGKAELDFLLSRIGEPAGPSARRGSFSSVGTGGAGRKRHGGGAGPPSITSAFDPDRALQALSGTFDSLAAGLVSWKETQKHAYGNLMAQAAELDREVLQYAEAFAAWEEESESHESKQEAGVEEAKTKEGEAGDAVAAGASEPPTPYEGNSAALQGESAMASALSALKAKRKAVPSPETDEASAAGKPPLPPQPGKATNSASAMAAPLDARRKEKGRFPLAEDASANTSAATVLPTRPVVSALSKDAAANNAPKSTEDPAAAVASSPRIAALLSELKTASDKCAAIAGSVRAVEKGIASKGGDTGGWAKDDHATFLSAWVAFTTSQFGVSAAAAAHTTGPSGVSGGLPLPEVKVVRGSAAAGEKEGAAPPAPATSGAAAVGIAALPRPSVEAVTSFATRLVATQLPLQTASTVRDHVDWWLWQQEQLSKRRELLATWRAAKLEEESVKRRLARAREEEAEENEGKRKPGSAAASSEPAKVSSPSTRAAIVEWKTKKALEEAAKKRQEEQEKAAAAEMAAAKAALWRERREQELEEWKRRQEILAKKAAKKEGGGRAGPRRRGSKGAGSDDGYDDNDDGADSRDAASEGDYRDHLATSSAELAARAAEAMRMAKEKRARIVALQNAAEDAKKRRFGDYDDYDDDEGTDEQASAAGDGIVAAAMAGFGVGAYDHRQYGGASAIASATAAPTGPASRRPPIPGLLPAQVRQFIGAGAGGSGAAASESGEKKRSASSSGLPRSHKPKLSAGTRSTYAYVAHDPTSSTVAHEARATTSEELGKAHVNRVQAAAHEQKVASVQPAVKGRSYTFGVSAGQRPMKAVPAWRKGVAR